MKKLLAAVAAAAFLTASPAVAEAKHGLDLKDTYSALYHAVVKHYGKRAPGRNIRKWGVVAGQGTRDATTPELARSVRTFRRWLAPPIATASATDKRPTAYRSSAANTGGKWAIPAYIVMCESGGDYSARNPSGARGAYQLMPATYAAYGGDGSWSPADQDRVAARLYAAEGTRPWVCG